MTDKLKISLILITQFTETIYSLQSAVCSLQMSYTGFWTARTTSSYINVPAQLYKNSGLAKAVINQLNRLEPENIENSASCYVLRSLK